MSAESLRFEINFALSKTGQPWEAAAALIKDFLRELHELMVKSNHDQPAMLAQVRAVLGQTSMHHLAKTLDTSTVVEPEFDVVDDATLYERTALICKQRSFDPAHGRLLIANFLRALDMERTDSVGNIESAPVMLYWAVGHEAAYHLGGLYTGELQGLIAIELGGYLDPTLRRFHKIVEMWCEELTQARRENE